MESLRRRGVSKRKPFYQIDQTYSIRGWHVVLNIVEKGAKTRTIKDFGIIRSQNDYVEKHREARKFRDTLDQVPLLALYHELKSE